MPELSPHHIVLGMAGHIDHGKTSLVKALTGIDTDRLKEEKERGMTTDLGFAFLGDDIAIIDVPGHEKFVKTMVAGVAGVDLALLVIAADDGIMPQTREHLEILRLLHISSGLVALNKADLVDDDWLALVNADIRTLLKGTFLEGAPVIPVSAVTGKGIDVLGAEIQKAAGSVQKRKDKGIFRMSIDRVFSMKGFGTVVAGTVSAGKVHIDDTVELLPQGLSLRVRGIQVHEKNVPESAIGQRTAINLQGIQKETIERGDVLVAPGYYTPTSMVDAHFSYLKTAAGRLENRTRVRVHVGTNEVIARLILLHHELLQAGEEGFVQIHFEKPVIADAGERFVVRSYSPLLTIGGGVILDVHPTKHKRFQEDVRTRLQKLIDGDPEHSVLEYMMKISTSLMTPDEIAKSISIPVETCLIHLGELQKKNEIVQLESGCWFAAPNLLHAQRRITEALERYHRENPLRAAVSSVEIQSRLKPPLEKKLLNSLCVMLERDGKIRIEADRLSLSEFKVQLTQDQLSLKEKIDRLFRASPLSPPGINDITSELGRDGEKILSLMIEIGEIVRLEDDVIIHKDGLELARGKIIELFSKKHQVTLSEIRQYLGIIRKHALPIALYFDAIGVTERDGDVRRLKKAN